jgi:thiamine biosynthesis lipoprotein
MARRRAAFRAMASEHTIVVDGVAEARADAAIAAAIADIRRIEAKYSRYRDDSVTSAINRAAGGAAVAVDAETAALLDYADQCFRISDGRFDVTSGVLRRAWDFRRVPPRLPDARELAVLCAQVGWSEVERDGHSIRLPRTGMEVDFGGIGKEYAADRAAAILAEHGVAHALVNLGGDVRALGGQADGSPWRIGVRHPRATDAGAAIAVVPLTDGAVATSGDYERYIEVDGRRYCHLLDPRTGWPVHAWQSVSVLAPLAVVAGSVATIAMLCADAAPALLASQGLPWLGVDAAGHVHGTLGT